MPANRSREGGNRYANLETANGNDALAFDLYLWNIGLAWAVLRGISFFEIALRNACVRAISSMWYGFDYWLFDDSAA